MQDTRGCLLELQRLAASKTDGDREGILDRVTDLFFLTSDTQGVMERCVFGDVIERIAYQLETAARARLAERLAEAQQAPYKLVCKLAGDEIRVARPILENSPCLKDHDLVHVAREHGQDHLHAISNRKELSTVVTDVIVQRGDDAVLTNVAGNSGAHFSSRGLKQLTTRAEANSDLFSVLEVRTDLPRLMLAEIKQKIANRLKQELAEIPSNITGEEVEAIVEARASQMNLNAEDQSGAGGKQRSRKQAITENMMVAFARTRMLTETIQCLSLMSSLSFKRVTHCLLNADLTALAVLCKANNFKNTTFAALMQLRSASTPLTVQVIADAMRHYEMLHAGTARRAVQSVRRKTAGEEKS